MGYFEVLSDKSTIHIRQMATHPDIQGKGVGKGLVQFVRDYRANTAQRIIADTRKINEKAVGFYVKQGFLLEKTTHDPSLDNRWYCGLTMDLRL